MVPEEFLYVRLLSKCRLGQPVLFPSQRILNTVNKALKLASLYLPTTQGSIVKALGVRQMSGSSWQVRREEPIGRLSCCVYHEARVQV